MPLEGFNEDGENYNSSYYWTSTKNTNRPWVLLIDSNNDTIYLDTYPQVFAGCAIRPVSDKKTALTNDDN